MFPTQICENSLVWGVSGSVKTTLQERGNGEMGEEEKPSDLYTMERGGPGDAKAGNGESHSPSISQ